MYIDIIFTYIYMYHMYVNSSYNIILYNLTYLVINQNFVHICWLYQIRVLLGFDLISMRSASATQ